MRKMDHSNSEDDDRLWKIVTSQINPLKSVRYSGGMDKSVDNSKFISSRKKPSGVESNFIPKIKSPTKKVKPVDLREGDHAGLDGRSRRKLASGNFRVEARIDLHGHNAQQAETKLRAFIEQSASLGHRCVLVITGKGNRGEGVLRRHAPLWLKQPPLNGCVLAISNATPKDGGTGAIYVMLRRART